MTQTTEQIRDEIRTLELTEILVGTNQGTYGGVEAARKVGSGDPAVADRNVYESVGGKVRATGPDKDAAPGRMRRINADEMGRQRKRLAELKALLRAQK